MYNRIKYDPYADAHTFSKIKFNSLYKQYIPIVRELFNKSIRASRGNYSIFDLQAELCRNILLTNKERKRLLYKKELCGKGLTNLVKRNAAQERIKRAQKDIETMQDYATAANWVIRQLRSIGDGIAWRFFNYDRATLRLLAEHDYVSVPEIDKGLFTEMDAIQLLQERGIPFLMNTITNFLRVGDITIYDKAENRYKLLEIKSGTRQTEKIIRQSKHRDFTQMGLNEGFQYVGGAIIMKRMSTKPLLTYVKSVENAMIEAEQDLASSRLFGDYLSVAVFPLSKIINKVRDEDMIQLQKRTLDRAMSVLKTKEDVRLRLMSNIFPLAHFIPVLAPYAIFPISPDRRFDILTGDFLILSQLNVSGLARWLQKRGWETKIVLSSDQVSEKNGEFKFIPVLKVWNGNKSKSIIKGVDIPLEILIIAALEFWMPQSIEAMISTIIELGIDTIGFHSVNLSNVGKYAWD